MMDMDFTPKKCIIILIILAFLAIAPQLLRPLPLGHDPFYYLAHAGDPQPGMPPAFFYLAELPIPLVTFAVVLATLLITYLIHNQLGADNPLSSVALLLAAPGLLFSMNKFEDDILGLPLCLGAVYLYMKGHKLPAAALLFLTFFVAWRGALAFAAMLMLQWLSKHFKYWYFALPLLCLYFWPNSLVGEEMFGLALVPVVLLGLLWGMLQWQKTCRFNRVWASFFLFLGVVNAKWLWLAAFPLALMTHEWSWERKKSVAILICGGLLFGGYWVVKAEPTMQQFDDLMEIKNSTTGMISNSWQTGHWANYLGIDTLNNNLNPQEIRGMKPPPWDTQYAIWHNFTNPLTGYVLVKNYSWIGLYEKEVTVNESVPFTASMGPLKPLEESQASTQSLVTSR